MCPNPGALANLGERKNVFPQEGEVRLMGKGQAEKEKAGPDGPAKAAQ